MTPAGNPSQPVLARSAFRVSSGQVSSVLLLPFQETGPVTRARSYLMGRSPGTVQISSRYRAAQVDKMRLTDWDRHYGPVGITQEGSVRANALAVRGVIGAVIGIEVNGPDLVSVAQNGRERPAVV